ncbi:MAG TPA: hypothetical protein ENH91_10205 [Leeuwenhoekiella sp.]|nr:hypothetical protein [Leeuwenhoekiella sp.]
MSTLKKSSWCLSLISGIIGSLAMYFLMKLGISKGFAPFNVPPSAAMTIKMGLELEPLALIIHLVYGALGSLVMIGIFKTRSSIKTGLIFAFMLWLLFMMIYSPIIGWGFFGFGEASNLAENDPLYLESGLKFLWVTLVLHIVYGIVIGLLNKAFAKKEHVNVYQSRS